MSEQKLLGKKALVTGAGVGIGLACALELAAQGADVALHYASSAGGAEDGARQIREMGRKACAVQGDLSSVEDCRRMVGGAIGALGGVDILVNNAGMTFRRDFLNVTQEDYDRVLNLNMRGYFFVAQSAVADMIRRGSRGSIINMTSIHAWASMSEYAVYATAKGAIAAFTRQLARELTAYHIRVNALAPGMIEVPRHLAMSGYDHEKASAGHIWGRVGEPRDCAKLTAFLASEDADFITAQIIAVDGGATAGQNSEPIRK